MGKLTNLNPPKAITAADLPSENAMDVEVAAAIAEHAAAPDPHPNYLTQTEGDARYIKALTQTLTINFPPLSGGNLLLFSYPFPGAAIGDPCLAILITTDLYSTSTWPFVFSCIVSGESIITIAIRNDFTQVIDLEEVQIRVLVIK